MGRYLVNSFIVSTSVMLLSLLFNTMAGYAFAKLRFKGRDSTFRALLAALVIPAQVAMMPLFLLLKQMGLVNTYAGAIVPGMAAIFGIFWCASTRARSRTNCWKPRASTVPAKRASSSRSCCRA